MCTTTDISQIIGNKEVSVVAGPTFLERPVRQGLSGTKSPAGNPAESGPVGKLIKSFGLPASDPFLAYKRVQSSERVSFKRAKTLASVEISTFLIDYRIDRFAKTSWNSVEKDSFYLASTFSFSVIYGINPRVHLSEKGVKTARESECGKTMGARFRARLPSYPFPFHLSSPEFSNPFPPFDPPSSIFTRRDAGE